MRARIATDVAKHELIGLEVEIRSRHASWNGLVGRVVNETKHTFAVERASGSEVLIPKGGQTFLFRVGSAIVELQGDDIKIQPEERTKKFRFNR